MNHPVHNISEFSAVIVRGGRGGCGKGWGGRGVHGERGGYKVPPPTAKEVSACTHISDQYFSDQKYKDLSPAEKARLW